MRTSIGWFCLAGFLVAPAAQASPEEVVWSRSYREGQEVGQKQGKPLAVFVGTGSAGHEQLTQEGSMPGDVKETLATHYVCVYLDAERADDQPLIRKLGITSGRGLVISDRAGEVQAFNHDGPLSTTELSRQLWHYAGPNVVVRATQSNSVPRLSFYPQAAFTPESYATPASYAAPFAPAYQPQFVPAAMGGRNCCR